MRFGLRGKIILITVTTPLVLGIATMVTVQRSVRDHVDSSSIHESLDHSVLVFEHMLKARARALSGAAEVIARDPRFFSLVTLGEHQRDRQFVATIRGMAQDFNRLTETEVFEIIDRRGRTLASVGAVKSTAASRDSLIREARAGRNAGAVALLDGGQYQLSATPIRADRRVVGVLLVGSEIGHGLARELRAQMRSEVTFTAGGVITATTLPDNRDRGSLLESIRAQAKDATPEAGGVLKVLGQELTYITVVRPIPGSAPANEQLYAMQRAFDPELAFLRRTQSDLGLLAVLALFAALATGAFLSGQIRRPIQQLVRAAQEIQKGNYAHPLNVKSGDEIGFLAQRFDDMRRREEVYVGGLEETMRIKSDFINIASHELRTPISVIAGYQALLESGQLGPLEPKQAQALQAIGGCVERLTRVADQATSMASIDNQRLVPDFETQPLEPIIGRAIGSALAATPGRQVVIDKRIEKGTRAVHLDPQLIEQALMNLIANAIRFTPEGGHVEIALRTKGEFVEIEISDSGPGIPDEQIAKLFDHGYAVRSSMHHSSDDAAETGGMGLGLGITRGIVEAHAGTIEAGNRPEGGACFTIRLPADPAARRAA